MSRDGYLLNSSNILPDARDQVPEFRGDAVSHCVRNVQRCCASLDHSFQNLVEELRRRTSRVFRRKFYVFAKRLGQPHRIARLFETLLLRDSQLVLEMNL